MNPRARGDTSILAELERVRTAYDSPVLTLLNSRTSDFQVAAMRTVFDADQATADYNVVVGRLDDAIAITPADECPAKDGRQLVAAWLSDRLLRSDDGDDGRRVLALTSSAQAVLRFVEDQTSVRPLLGESRVTAITEAISDLAARASGSTEARKDRLRRQIAQLTEELERLEAGGEIEDITADDIIDQTSHLLDMASTLPEQFTKVAEAIRDNHQRVAARLRADDHPQGVIARDYLDSHDGLQATAEGRAYASATEILRSEDRLARLADDITRFLAHPATAVLTDGERVRLAQLETDLRIGIETVRVEHRRVTGTFSRYVRAADPAADRAVARAVREAISGLQQWLSSAGARDTVGVEIGNERRLDFQPLPVRWPNPGAYAPPADPTTDPGSERSALSFAELAAMGGPRTRKVLERMPALACEHGARTLGEVFAYLPDDLRRPVELVGLVAEARAIGASIGAGQTEIVIGRRSDGTVRELRIPLIHLSDDGQLAIAPSETNRGTS